MDLRCLAVALLASGCAHRHEEQLVTAIEDRTGAGLDREREPDEAPSLPPKVELGDGLSADEAVAIAVWNSPGLRADLTRLAAAEADLAGARRPGNPTLRLLFPIGGAQLSTLLTWPLEAFARMPSRLELAERNLDAVALDIERISVELARDVRLAHADWLLAHDRSALREEIVRERAAIAEIIGVQAEFGERAETDLATAEAELAVARDEARRAEMDVEMATLQLRGAIGWGGEPLALAPESQADALDPTPPDSADALVVLALDSRPELRASEINIEGAQARLRAERWNVLGIAAAVQQPGGGGVQVGPQVELPIFSQNQAGRGRARAGIDEARWRQRALSDQITVEVRRSHAQLSRAIQSHDDYREDIVAARERALAAAQAAWELGERDFTDVLLAEQDLDAARLRMVELRAEVRRARAELERALGGRLEAVP